MEIKDLFRSITELGLGLKFYIACGLFKIVWFTFQLIPWDSWAGKFQLVGIGLGQLAFIGFILIHMLF